ncbi:hypothetical protein H1D32_22955 [Anaerobacillus sp. CMMVII]|uniref:hypothetical protein n=1 Tax=Anaerobacillus sp. CMMVII TaxID=2755588 RepID=UPI0021B7B5E9|nr:hypothetical protein [Anaerobacillus sp. CMMVII]MCT8140303.1 hypothetical protein [Anaerobacillus sp. CMMVII]
MIKTLYLLMDLTFVGLLIFGLLQSKRYSFFAGVYSFLILIFLKLYSFVAPYSIKPIIENISEPPFGSSTSEFVAFLNLIPKTLNLIAFSILIIGLFQRLKK